MLDTPPHAPFVTTPVPPSNNPGQSIVPERNVPRRHGRARQQTPTANATQAPEHSQVSSRALGSTMSEADNAEEQSFLEAANQEAEDAKALIGLRDISSLATWTLSSAKPGCALAQLRHPHTNLFWQSDGPQPHTLTLHFFKLVAIVKMRIYLDFDLDESYTPTKMKFYAGMSEGGLVEFGTWQVLETIDEAGEPRSDIADVRGWIDVPLKGVGGREARYHEVVEQEEDHMDSDGDEQTHASRSAQRAFSPALGLGKDTNGDPNAVGDVLKAMVVQVRICENHQNGKDTHVRGFQVFAGDEASMKDVRKKIKKHKTHQPVAEDAEEEEEVVGLQPADWMGDPEIR
jgi:Anaphase-promoting complex, subunit 10 (APC10)